ncbi:alpha-amylase [Mycolicibacterium thermoresistibile ATCC 19527]|uniref:Alpha-amylase n=1 Tax=Mycolicibacterium thermoresistibile (strain ATCC 19527 / DSM 44167 / CIP 105390 / JCM 6362 / NCTC 10409 / 316) TaxID=1078020 RepID=G7CJD1_MYCT3|nr:alpha-amylase [Mycolicibacterium thermoresistibile ATCC 19527]
MVFRRDGGLICALNTGPDPLPLPAGTVLLASAPVTDGALPPNTAAWVSG